ncbi:BlaI/MecI/CopY family transcriptional regulator [Inhella proteolytica]|uniref:BlaI/MecI/CopY family transcriptional regulator n=1 Tax=Inhella proteolytica TaxID=2795029 RepID=A0A931J558_9BURK|nr:BlaI/MecI/CopY family transcriptional regulator [Inhella proteolytica]MBH9577047.1 BlaI/MecI/CopY family transcriptional regulator [Inhella proteolytica]
MRISEAELHVMEFLWERGSATSEDLVAALGPAQGWQPGTVKTLLNRLLGKQAIAAEKDGRRFLYQPLLQREDWLRAQSTTLLDRFFNGRLSALVTHFADQRPLSPEDRRALAALLKDQPDA